MGHETSVESQQQSRNPCGPPGSRAIIRHLAAAIAKQDAMNEELRTCILEQRANSHHHDGCAPKFYCSLLASLSPCENAVQLSPRTVSTRL